MLHVHEKNFTSHILNYEKTIFDKKIAKCDTTSFNLEKQ